MPPTGPRVFFPLALKNHAHIEKVPPQRKIGFDPQESLAQHDKGGDLKNRIGVEIMEFQTVKVEQTPEEPIHQQPQSTLEKGGENYHLIWPWLWLTAAQLWQPPPRHLLLRQKLLRHQLVDPRAGHGARWKLRHRPCSSGHRI
jgi:hypothetical protein